MRMRLLGVCCSAFLSLVVSQAHGGVPEGPSGALVSFLAVTGRPTEEEVVRKVEALRRDGIDSVLVYPRYGLELDYLGEDWFRMMGWFCREAKRRGMKIWLYDEFGFPSGSCNCRVTTEPGAPQTYRLTEQGVFRNDDGTFRRETRYADKEVGNIFDRGAVRRFVELTHEAYSARLKSFFDDGTIVAVFTDEPGTPIGPHWPLKPLVRYAVWEGLEDEYRAATKGRDFAADVDAFLRDESKADVWKTYSALKGKRLRDVFYGTVNDWCRRVGVRSTGHLTEELCMIGGPLVQGDILHVLKGETLPGMDEVFTKTAKADIEWITLAVAQHAIARGEGGGLVELFALGPNDMSAARMRQMIWLEALHGVDTYLVSMEVMDQRGLLTHFLYLAPVQEGQPWHKDLRVLADEANRAARFARKTDFRCEVAVRYPQADAAVDTYRLCRGEFKWNTLKGPALRPLLAELRGRQTDVDLIEETEPTDRRFVFRVEGEKYVEERSGERFASARAAADWVLARTCSPVRAYEADGSVADDLIVRCYGDGSAVLLNIRPDAERKLAVEQDGVRWPVAIPSRGVCVLESRRSASWSSSSRKDGKIPLSNSHSNSDSGRSAVVVTESRTPVNVSSWNVSFDGPNLHRLVLDDRGAARFSTDGAKDLRLVLQVVPEASFLLDGKPVVSVADCASLPVEYRPLYREVPLPDLADGEHVLVRANGQAETNFFLPQAFVAGRFAERGARLEAPCESAKSGPLAAAGLGSYVGDVVYSSSVRVPEGDDVRLVLPKAEAFVRVRWNGEDLGVRAWAPYEWRMPQGASEGTLEIVVSTSVVNMLGSPEAVKRARLRGWPRDRRTSEGLSVQPEWSVRK